VATVHARTGAISSTVAVRFVEQQQQPVSDTLAINYPNGKPGSYFTFHIGNFPPNTQLTVNLNGKPLGTITTDAAGTATFVLNTQGAAVGTYTLTVQVASPTHLVAENSASITFTLAEDAPLREREAGTEVPELAVEPQQQSIPLYLPLLYT
jgi:uncharacterized surface anchored protein